jgi:hypothetical protein
VVINGVLGMKTDLTSEEIALLKSWLWEHVHSELDGPAHVMANEQRVDVVQCLLVAKLCNAAEPMNQSEFVQNPEQEE